MIRADAVAAAASEVLGVSDAAAAALASLGSHLAAGAAGALSMALGQPVHVGPGTLRALAPGEIENESWDVSHPVDVRLDVGGTTFAPLLLLPKTELQSLLPAARGAADLPDMEALGALLRDLAEHLTDEIPGELPVRIGLPEANDTVSEPFSGDQQVRLEHRVVVGTQGSEIELAVAHILPAAALRLIAESLPHEDGAAEAPANAEDTTTPSPSSAAAGAPGGEARTMEDQMTSGPASAQPAGTSVHSVQFQPFDGDGEGQGGTNLELLLDVYLRVAVELGRTELTIKEVLGLGPGSVVELDKLAGEPVDILVNDRLIAKGEVVVVDENFGVRVTDIVSPQKRVGRLR